MKDIQELIWVGVNIGIKGKRVNRDFEFRGKLRLVKVAFSL